ncbi:glycosyltransferase 87 family protein [Kitasatospora sp. DSM 101779]|uniref:glycosyltransferase 87 family protein n=1 Tax=Kitasatospora sp. DSM 101779 TaxID=2853165 RepID=UPI0021D8A890|nr:glycosyltransferase 87 family protein [Kitasatospora sp. DSM 101779]
MELAPTGRTGSTSSTERLALTGSPPPAPAGGALWALGLSWVVTRVLIVLMAVGVLRISGTDVSSDISVIYHGWYEVLRTGTFPLDDVTWQYPPGAALVILLPGVLPWSYLVSFFVLCGVFDALTAGALMRVGTRRGRSFTGAWMWVAGVPLLGPTVYCRYDIIVTALAVGGLLLVLRRPALGGFLLGLGGLVKVWPVLALAGTPRGRRTRRAWTAAAATAASLGFLLTAGMNGAFEFLKFQKERGIEVESLGALPLHFAKLFGAWDGQVTMNYGSLEMLGPWVPVVSKVCVAGTLLGFGWLLLWRLRAVRWQPSTPYDAALAALLVFTVTSRVISPQYLVWLVGLAAVCLTVRGTRQKPVAVLILAATVLTTVEFPILFGAVQHSEPWGVAVLTARNLLLLAATVLSCRRLWRSTRGPDAQATLVLPPEPPVKGYPVRPGIAYEQALLDDLDRPVGRPAPTS